MLYIMELCAYPCLQKADELTKQWHYHLGSFHTNEVGCNARPNGHTAIDTTSTEICTWFIPCHTILYLQTMRDRGAQHGAQCSNA